MREIKFRGKRLENGEWVYGDLVQIEGSYIYDYDIGDNGVEQKPILSQIKWNVNPKTVGQYTGLKDSNGREIYEGDIVIVGPKEIALDKWTKPSPVIYQAGGYLVSHSDENTWLCAYAGDTQENFPYLFTCEVIGNIYDNPELLEVKDV